MTEQLRNKLMELTPNDLLVGIEDHKIKGVKINIINYVAKHYPALIEAAEKDFNEDTKLAIKEEMIKYIKSLLH